MAEEDRIRKLFENSTIFITGGTGFLGKVLIEKLLRSCKVKKLYLLVRTKKGKAPQERLEDIFSNVIFDLLKSQDPTAIAKCTIIPGDISQSDLGINPQDLLILQEEADFIYHSAASTRFDDSVKTAVKVNTGSTQKVLKLAEGCKRLKAFVHVSTAYAYPDEKILYEKSYKPPSDPHKVLDMVEFSTDEDTEKLLGKCPNTYTFSKALAEALVMEKIGRIPCIIVRPSVVCPTLQDPLKGWCNNLQGPMGLFVGAGKGIIRTMYMQENSYADFIPADIVINAMLVSVWYFLNISNKDQIFNLTASSEHTYNWNEVIETGKDIIYNEIPFNGAVWYPGGSIKQTRWVHDLCFFFFQLIPAIFLDFLLMILGYKPILYQIQRRIQKGGKVFEYYTNKTWNFSNVKAAGFKDYMNEFEKKVYRMDGDGVVLKEYLVNCIRCVRRNNLKESDETLPGAKRHMKIMWFVDLVTKGLFVAATLYYLYQLVLKSYIFIKKNIF